MSVDGSGRDDEDAEMAEVAARIEGGLEDEEEGWDGRADRSAREWGLDSVEGSDEDGDSSSRCAKG